MTGKFPIPLHPPRPSFAGPRVPLVVPRLSFPTIDIDTLLDAYKGRTAVESPGDSKGDNMDETWKRKL